MIAFARFVMRDNGLAIHINTQQVTQVRQTTEGEPAIYIVGRESPMVVEGTLEAAIRKLEAAAAGLKIVEPAVETMVEAPAARPPAPELAAEESVATPQSSPEPLPDVAAPAVVKAKPAKTRVIAKQETKAKPVKDKPESKPAKAESKPAKAESKPAKAESKPAKAESKPTKTPEVPYPAASWFMGNR